MVSEDIRKAHAARDRASWHEAISLYQGALAKTPHSAELANNIALCYVGLGQFQAAIQYCARALTIRPDLWQSLILLARSQRALGQIDLADQAYSQVLRQQPDNPTALLGRADLAMNLYGDPLAAMRLVQPLYTNHAFAMDAQLTQLLASLYDREASVSALKLAQAFMKFSSTHLQLEQTKSEVNRGTAARAKQPRAGRKSSRPRVAIISNKFCASPVYFLTIAGWQRVAKGSDLIVINRGHQEDWATKAFKNLATEWHELQHMPAALLAQTLAALELDVLYDLGGWMDPIALQALSLRPATQQFKWVGGQSVTTGLHCFDGWIGDQWQSPLDRQNLYTEPLINIPQGYAHYTPPDYLPKPKSTKSKIPCIFSNPAKVSRAFLNYLNTVPGKKVFIHQQYQFARTQERITAVLGEDAEFMCPSSHREALDALNCHATMIDTFPYTSGLTAYEARALGTTVQVVRVGDLFCERHTAAYFKN